MVVVAVVEDVTVAVAVPLIPLRVAVMVEDPAATPVARPEELMVAVDAFDEDQIAVEVTSPVELSL